jgi:Domain of unknown function (DUF5053)
MKNIKKLNNYCLAPVRLKFKNMEIQAKKDNVKSLVWDIVVDISWANLSHKYFGKSRSWISQKFVGINGNGVDTDFTEDERQKLKYALNDLATRIQSCASKL